MTKNFPTPAEQRAAIMRTFGQYQTDWERKLYGKPAVHIDSFARLYAPAVVRVDGETYDVDIYRDRNGTVRTGDTFNRAYEAGIE